MKLSTKSKYGVEALVYMACHPENAKWQIREMAMVLHVAERYLEQIFHLLKKAHLLSTQRGPKGGYVLDKTANEIYIGDIIRAVEGELIPVPCIRCVSACRSAIQEQCVTRTLWCNMLKEVESIIDTLTVQDLVDQYKKMEATISEDNN